MARGPGETQLEIDRRGPRSLGSIATRVGRSATPKESRSGRSNRRSLHGGPGGLTNAGKARSSIASPTVARLPPTCCLPPCPLGRRLALGVVCKSWSLTRLALFVISRTAWWLPSATLEETIHLTDLQVLDASDPHAVMQLETTERTLDDIDATGQPRLVLLNKMDLIEPRSGCFGCIAIPMRCPSPRWTALASMNCPSGSSIPRRYSRGRGDVALRVGQSDRPFGTPSRSVGSPIWRWHGDVEVKLARRQADELASLDRKALINGEPASNAGSVVWGEVQAIPEPGVPPHKRSPGGWTP